MPETRSIRLTINGREVNTPRDVTVLRAAELNGFYIPTLCSHKDLSPFGGCRLCIVEIDGIRGYPLACSTVVADGMAVRADTIALQEIRREVLQLILSEHPSSCLICGESKECRSFMGTVRKAGVSTGCRYCPNDGQCELQDVVERLEVKEIGYPILYRGIEVEREDPFYDRDYNICILCGRCVRMCQEMRGTGVLAFHWRGSQATIGPAFGRSHIEAGCEFCGSCVSVCPTGALTEKASKWDGTPDGAVESTCPYCSIGCRLDLWHRNGRFSKAIPVVDSDVNDGQACLKGRFCLGEVSHHVERARKPMALDGGYWKETTWEDALARACRTLKGIRSDEFALLVSPDCTNEALYVAQKFARCAIGTNAVDSTARTSLGGDLGIWRRLFRETVSIQGIREASRILAVGVDTRFSFSVVGVEVRKALQRGAKLVTIDARESNLARYADLWLRPRPGDEGTMLEAIARALAGDRAAELEEAAEILTSGEGLTVILGPSVFHQGSGRGLVSGLRVLLDGEKARIVPLYNGANARGAVEMGTFPEILPGGTARQDARAAAKVQSVWGSPIPEDPGFTVDDLLLGRKRPRVLYLVGAVPFLERPDCEVLIVQDIFRPDFGTDLFLPATSFFESGGTLINIEGRVQELQRLEELPDSVMYGSARPDWWILSQIARRLGREGFDYENETDVRKEIASLVRGFPGSDRWDRRRRTLPRGRQPRVRRAAAVAAAAAPASSNYLLVLQPGNYAHRGVDVTSKVEGLQILDREGGFAVHPDAAASLGVSEGGSLTVKADGAIGSGPITLDETLPRGTIYLSVPEVFGGLRDRGDLEPLYRLRGGIYPVEVVTRGV